MSKEEFKKQYMMKLQGKEYLPVAPRVVMFRQEHPDWSLLTEYVEVMGVGHMRADVLDGTGKVLARAHKKIRDKGAGPAAQFPVETSETGAIGRALSLCGYGTIEAGDLDEGEDIADAPVEKNLEPKAVGPKPTQIRKIEKNQNATPEQWVDKLDALTTLKEFDTEYPHALDFMDTLGKKTEEYATVYQAVVRAGKRVGKTERK